MWCPDSGGRMEGLNFLGRLYRETGDKNRGMPPSGHNLNDSY